MRGAAFMEQVVRLAGQLGAQLQMERRRRSMTQTDLAGIVGTHQKTISAIENGSEGARLETLLRIIAALDLDMQIIPRRKIGKRIEDIF
ncbi:helix-turn-helix domain-containing protein [Sphingomonas sp. LH128]|uniref:helix-turn-helix domain-containing protein n=1 Tax=Sphingomonas sp. LH128 TaxID=473781 RepID=UPI0009FDE4FF|nr:helix-turn-helix domain-containing protein [Sphingomonas sp. LH128]